MSAHESGLLPAKISVVIPCLNAAGTLERCLRSVINQTYPHKELIVIDGASTDASVAIIERHADSIARWSSVPDEGVYHAMARGAAMATGEWLYFLGADDALHDPDVLQDIFKANTTNDDVIYGDVWWRGARFDGKTDAYKIRRKNICHQAIFLRRSVYAKLGGFNLEYAVLADYEMNLRLFGDPDIRKRHVDRVIAHFATGGRSERGDEKFARDKERLVRRHTRVPRLQLFLLALRYRLLKKRSRL